MKNKKKSFGVKEYHSICNRTTKARLGLGDPVICITRVCSNPHI